MIRVGIVAGESSGDQLGASLIEALRSRHPDICVEGIAGPAMIAAGCRVLYPSDKLSVMGLFEVLAHLPELLRIRRNVYRYFSTNPPDVFIGVDAPDFNLSLERRLRAIGIKTVHFVSPSVWAWRQRRVRKIARSVDLMLTLFPFEKIFYQRHHVPVRFVGHPFADQISLQPDRAAARRALDLAPDATIVALLPGSRAGEIQRLGKLFLLAAQRCSRLQSELRFVAPMASASLRQSFDHMRRQIAPELPLTLTDGRAREVLAAADVVLLASGTAALEAMLMKRPMVVAYRVAPLTYFILKHLRIMKVSRFSLPNLLAGRDVVPEFIQDEATPERLADAISGILQHPEHTMRLHDHFLELHRDLRCGAGQAAADAVLELISDTRRLSIHETRSL